MKRSIKQTHRQTNWMKLCALAFLPMMMFSLGCTKKKELKFEGNHSPYFEKSSLDGKMFYLVRGVEEMDAKATIPSGVGTNQDWLVKAEVLENEVRFTEVFNPQVQKSSSRVLVAFPIEHFDRQRDRNDYGEETNKIVEDTKKPWQDRRHIRIDWSKPSNHGSFGSLIRGRGSEVSNVENIEPAKIEEDGVISVLQDVTFLDPYDGYVNWYKLDKGHANSFRAKIRTYLMPYKKTDFKALDYTSDDFKKFGFFYTQQNFQDPLRGLLDSTIKRKAMIFNVCESSGKGSCATNKIVWHLNKNFDDRFLGVTRRIFKEWNEVFKKALDRSDDVVVLNESLRVNPYDPRYNVFTYYPHDISSAPLGVANFVSDPISGEIVAGRATVFGSGVRSATGFVDELIDILLNEDQFKKQISQISKSSVDARNGIRSHLVENSERRRSHKRPQHGSSKFLSLLEDAKRGSLFDAPGNRMIEMAKKAPSSFQKLSDFERSASLNTKLDLESHLLDSFNQSGMPSFESFKRVTSQFKDLDLNGLETILSAVEQVKLENEAMLHQAETGIHGPQFIESATLSFILKYVGQKGVESLISQREQITRDLEERVFYDTMIHELGHAFGLRHNFAASSDLANYSPEFTKRVQARQQGDKSVVLADVEATMTSSVMDYPEHFYFDTKGPGSYDLAAIRYAYNRSLDKTKDPIVSRPYKFCTDHHVSGGESLLCQRWDTGYTVSQVIENAIDTYEERYFLATNRRDRAHFNSSAMRVGYYLMRNMFPIRRAVDELYYNMITRPDLIQRSIQKGEILNILDAEALGRAQIDPADPGQVFQALLKEDKTQFLKSTKSYEPEGFADLFYATYLSQEFFVRVLGTTEPGFFLLDQNENGEDVLRSLPKQASVQDALASYAQSNGISNVEQFVAEKKTSVYKIEAGPYARAFNSSFQNTGFGYEFQNVGSVREKMAAMIAMSTRDLGVLKYDFASLHGNMYSYPFTKGVTYDSFSKLMRGEAFISNLSTPLKREDDQVVHPLIEGATSFDTQFFSAYIAVANMVIPGQEESMLNSLNVCDKSRSNCVDRFQSGEVSFTSSNGTDHFVAFQNLDGNSIVYDLVKEVSQIAQKRDGMLKVRNESLDLFEKLPARMKEISVVRDELADLMNSYQSLKKVRAGLTADVPLTEESGSLWSLIDAVARNAQIVNDSIVYDSSQQIVKVINYFYSATSAELIKLEKEVGLVTQPLKEGERPSKSEFNALAFGFKVDVDSNFKGPESKNEDFSKQLGERRRHLIRTRSSMMKYLMMINETSNGIVSARLSPRASKNLNEQVAIKERAIKLIIRMVDLAKGL